MKRIEYHVTPAVVVKDHPDMTLALHRARITSGSSGDTELGWVLVSTAKLEVGGKIHQFPTVAVAWNDRHYRVPTLAMGEGTPTNEVFPYTEEDLAWIWEEVKDLS